MRIALSLAILAVSAGAAAAQVFTPLSGPNTPVPSPVCDLINFGFCPQPAPPPPPFPDPNATAEAPVPLHPVMERHHRRHRRHPVG